MNNEWIKWNGGECPVEPSVRVEIIFRGGDAMICFGHALSWGHLMGPGDIVSYRVVEDDVLIPAPLAMAPMSELPELTAEGTPLETITDPTWIEATFAADDETHAGTDVITVRLPTDVYGMLVRTAETQGQDFNDLVAEILRAHIERPVVNLSINTDDLRNVDLSKATLEVGRVAHMMADLDDAQLDGLKLGAVFGAFLTAPAEPRKHNHYFKDVSHLDTIDVYRVLSLFNVTDPCIQHAVKKLLVAGGRGAGKDISRDIKEAIDSLQRWQEMRAEDAASDSADGLVGPADC